MSPTLKPGGRTGGWTLRTIRDGRSVSAPGLCVTGIVHIGKESHELEEVQAGLVPAAMAYVRYPDDRDEWERDKETLKTVPRRLLAKWSGLHVRSVKAILNTARLPHAKHRRILHEIAEKLRRQGSSTS